MKNPRKQILLITDSLAFPRNNPETVRYENTYIAMLKEEFRDYDFIHLGYGGATIRHLFQHTSYFHTSIVPALVIMHCGVVDCAPRAVTVTERKVISSLPIVGPLFRAAVKRYANFLRHWRGITYTPLSVFINYIDRFESIFSNVCWIEILPPSESYENEVVGISRNIQSYNKAIRSRNFVRTDDFTMTDIMSDHHHLNLSGHSKLFRRIASLILEL